MAYREVHGVEIQEIIRRWQAGLSQRRIASGMGLSRQTVRRYIDAAEAAGLTPDGPEPSEEQLAALATLSLSGPRQVEAPSEELLSPWAEQIERWLETDRLQLTRIQELLAGRGCEVSRIRLSARDGECEDGASATHVAIPRPFSLVSPSLEAFLQEVQHRRLDVTVML